MATQTTVAVTQGSGKNIDATVTSTAGNVRQAITLADPLTDANYVNVLADGSIKVSVYGAISLTGGNSSVSGTTGASIIGTAPVTQSGTWSQSIVGATASVLQLGVWNVNAAGSVLGATVGGINAPASSITGSPVYIGGKDANASIQGAQIIGGALMTVGSVSGSVGLTGNPSISGTVNATETGTWSVSVVGATASVLQIGTWSQSVVGATASVLQLGTWSVSVVGATASVLQLGTWNVNAASSVVGATASVSGVSSVGGTITENPITVGVKAINAEQKTVGNATKAQLVSDLAGKQIILPYANPENFVSGVTSVVTGTTATSVLAAAGSGLRNYVTHMVVTNIAASVVSVGVKVNITDDGTGNVLYAGYAAANGGGFSLTLPTPLRQPSSNFSISITPTTQGSIVAAMTGYIGA